MEHSDHLLVAKMNVHLLHLELVHDLRGLSRNGIYHELLLHLDMMAIKRFVVNDICVLSSTERTASCDGTIHANMLNFSSFGSGILSSTYDRSLYTCIVCIIWKVYGRFIDIDQGQKLHLWRSDLVQTSFPFLISSICSCGSNKMQANEGAASPSWIAAGLSSGQCCLA
ncbi:hypothetical protein Tco_0602575 [Tanacetum coccineum]